MVNYPKVCLNCGKEYTPTGHCQKYCASCKDMMDKKRLHDAYKARYIPKGYSQLGEKNNNWKGGIGTYRKTYEMKDNCERCGATELLLIHHRDRNRYNNCDDNLETLCKQCHQKEHSVRDATTGRFISTD